MLRRRDVDVVIGETLKGGTVSQVFSARESGRPVVIKYTTDCYDADPTVLFLSSTEHAIDTRMLSYLADKEGVRIPKVYYDFTDELPLTVMEDLRSSRFTLLQDHLNEGKLPLGAAVKAGHAIANLLVTLKDYPEFITPESAWQCYYERGFEVRQAYPNDQKTYVALEHRFTTANQQLIAVDTHPKNSFVHAQSNEIAWIDFGRSVWGDRDFVLPNFLAHIAIYALVGSISKNSAASFIQDAVVAYRKVLPIEDEVFNTYLAAEVMHRWAGKWIGGVETAEQKIALLRFGMRVFDEKIGTLPKLISLLLEHEASA